MASSVAGMHTHYTGAKTDVLLGLGYQSLLIGSVYYFVFSDGELKATFPKPLMLLVEDGHRDLQAANVK
ncbi:Small GTPase superfamily [Gossypium australe]|uniref:Small GTPase superfamily n=1 Tax=Gossypium australe TaxID=47621 RepID=A0A5B6WDJ3_9ROSI|nr:Small GTPase superfamily [Gossypium australe]